MGKASRLRAERAAEHGRAENSRFEAPLRFEAEYPALSAADIAEGAAKRLAKSQRKFNASGAASPQSTDFLNQTIGKLGSYAHSSASAIDEWLQGWRMPDMSDGRPDVESSASVFVGLTASRGMPETSPLHPGPPFVSVTAHFIEQCWRLAELFPTFSVLAHSTADASTASGLRDYGIEYCDISRVPSELASQMVHRNKDDLYTIRTTSAAIRWAIAHEMAHAVATEKERKEAYEKAASLLPGMESAQWAPLRSQLSHHKASIALYRDEIACDYLASQYVLASPFSTSDLMTQVSGSLLAIHATVLDGYFQDGSAISDTHPSPTLRFQLVYRAWLDTLIDMETWKIRDAPGAFGLDDFAYLVAFERWCAGEYREHRSGAVWDADIQLIQDIFTAHGPTVGPEPIYASLPEGLFRVPLRGH